MAVLWRCNCTLIVKLTLQYRSAFCDDDITCVTDLTSSPLPCCDDDDNDDAAGVVAALYQLIYCITIGGTVANAIQGFPWSGYDLYTV